jgi:signal transduction histidine kinase/DNA-binding response OmpR family regulator
MKIKTILLIGFLAVLTIILFGGTLGIVETNKLYTASKEASVKNAPLADATMEIMISILKAQLGLEEIISGTTKKPDAIDEVWELFDESLWYSNAILKGGQNAKNTFHPANDGAIEVKILGIKTTIKTLQEIAQLRFDNHLGTQKPDNQNLDKRFETVLNRFIKNVDEVEAMLRAKIVRDIQTVETIATIGMFLLSIATILGVVVVSTAAYYLGSGITKQVGGEPAEIAHITEQIAAGNLEIQFESGTATGIYAAVQTMVQNLKTINHERQQQNWLKTGQAQLNEQMRGELDIVTLTKKIISFLTTYVEAQVGIFYLLEEADEPSLNIVASYAYTISDKHPQKFFIGEGLVGQVALEQKTISLTQTAAECPLIIRSGLAGALPCNVLLLPFLYENTLKGVIEIGAAQLLTDIQRDFLEQAMQSIGIAVNTAESRTKMQTILAQAQQQAQELQVQQEKLRSTNEELQSQSEELQTQQEELRQTNEQLETNSHNLEQQKEAIQEKNLVLEKTQAEMARAKAAIETKAKELELASKYKSEFLANMSHELRTPLNSLLILAQLLEENKQSNLTTKQVEYAQTIYSSGSDLLTIINEILDLSKVESGKIAVNIAEVSLADLTEAIEQKFRLIAQDKGLKFHIIVADDVPAMLRTDGQRLQQIINNLLSNAFKFTNKGEIKITFNRPADVVPISQLANSKKILDLSKTIAINVVDTGIGIPKGKQKLIFEAFQQVDGTTSRRYGGTGLGLSISRQLARLLGGELILESEEGFGSTFTFYLPTNLETQNTEVLQSTPSQTEAGEDLTVLSKEITSQPEERSPISDDRNDLQPGDKSILIVEDDRKFSSILMELAQGRKLKCLVAEDGLTGLQLAEKYKPSAIILDVGLPQLDGWLVMDKLKDNPITRHIPVHFMSAVDQSMEAKKMGAIGYLLKPVSVEQIGEAFKTIEQFLTKTVKNLLVVVNNEYHQQKILKLVGGENIQIKTATTSASACQYLQNLNYDCIILDMDIEQGSGGKLLEQMQQKKGPCQIPVIVYADRDLTPAEEAILLQCADELPIKSVSSPERLLDEATLFLHQVETNLSDDKRNMLRMVHDKSAILKLKKVLIIDDDIRNAFALATVLEEHDMEIICATNGKQGLALLKENDDVAIILMDIMMPKMDGYETMREIRQQPQYRKMPIIALTAKAMKGDKTKCIEAGANDYISKPVDTNKLLSLMRVWLYH